MRHLFHSSPRQKTNNIHIQNTHRLDKYETSAGCVFVCVCDCVYVYFVTQPNGISITNCWHSFSLSGPNSVTENRYRSKKATAAFRASFSQHESIEPMTTVQVGYLFRLWKQLSSSKQRRRQRICVYNIVSMLYCYIKPPSSSKFIKHRIWDIHSDYTHTHTLKHSNIFIWLPRIYFRSTTRDEWSHSSRWKDELKWMQIIRLYLSINRIILVFSVNVS